MTGINQEKITHNISFYKSSSPNGNYTYLLVFKKTIINGYIDKIDQITITKGSDVIFKNTFKVEKPNGFVYSGQSRYIYHNPTDLVYRLSDIGVGSIKHNKIVNSNFVKQQIPNVNNSKKITRKQFLQEVSLMFNDGVNIINDLW